MKKVLIITYYWPPAGGPGVQRWLNFVRFLPDFGIQPVVYIPENPNYPMEDSSFLEEVPKGVEIIKRPIFEPYKMASVFSKEKTRQISKGIISSKKQSFTEKILLWIRGNLFIPDARKFWIKPSVKYLKGFLQKEAIQTIITTGPPHSVHLIGLQLKNELRDMQWIADFRDPWTNIGYHSELKLTSRSQGKHKKLEKAVLNSADKIITTSFTTKAEFEVVTKRPIKVITNGYLHVSEGNKTLDKKFSMAHIGSLLSGRNPKKLWQALAELIEEKFDFAKDFQLTLAGTVSEDVLKSIEKAGLGAYLDLKGYVSHEEAIALQQSAQVLLLIEINAAKTRGIIPGKLFEYMAAKRPILAVGPEKWDVERILKQTDTGFYFDYDNKKALKHQIFSFYQHYKNADLCINSEQIAAYHRKELTKKLAEYISDGNCN